MSKYMYITLLNGHSGLLKTNKWKSREGYITNLQVQNTARRTTQKFDIVQNMTTNVVFQRIQDPKDNYTFHISTKQKVERVNIFLDELLGLTSRSLCSQWDEAVPDPPPFSSSSPCRVEQLKCARASSYMSAFGTKYRASLQCTNPLVYFIILQTCI